MTIRLSVRPVYFSPNVLFSGPKSTIYAYKISSRVEFDRLEVFYSSIPFRIALARLRAVLGSYPARV